MAKTVLVTGPDGGIGLATARRFGGEGATVVRVARNPERLADATEQVKAAGAPDAWDAACDGVLVGRVAAVVGRTLERFGSLDVVVNNAGLMTTEPRQRGDARRCRHAVPPGEP